MDEGKAFAGAVMLVAAALIAVGRMHVRRGWRISRESAGGPRRRAQGKRALGWGITLMGVVMMVVGVVLW